MKKSIKIIVSILMVLVLFFGFSACGYEEKIESTYPIISARYYTETEERGVIAVKTDVHERIEVVYKGKDGVFKKIKQYLSSVEMGTENIVIVTHEGYFFEYHTIILTPDYYNKICGIQPVKNEEG